MQQNCRLDHYLHHHQFLSNIEYLLWMGGYNMLLSLMNANVSIKHNRIMHKYYYMFWYVIPSLGKYLPKSYHRSNASSVLETDKIY